MSSDPKGPEPDYLSWLVARASEDRFYDAATLFPQAVEYGRQCEAEIQRKDATMAELQREIEGYRQALEKAHRDRIAQSNGYSCGCWWDNKDDEAPGGVTLIVSPDCWLQRVLAGKEAQG